MSFYWCQMKTLDKTHPDAFEQLCSGEHTVQRTFERLCNGEFTAQRTFEQLCNGEFTVQRTFTSFSQGPVDQTIEQTLNQA